MKYMTKFIASLLLALAMVSVAGAASFTPAADMFAVYQSESADATEAEAAEGEAAEGEAAEGEQKKKKEEEPDCE